MVINITFSFEYQCINVLRESDAYYNKHGFRINIHFLISLGKKKKGHKFTHSF